MELHCTSLLHLGFCLGFLLVGELQLDQMSFDPLLSLPRNPLVELCRESSPGCLSEWCSASIFCNQLSVFHTPPHLKVLYNQAKIRKQTGRSTCASQMPVGLASVNNPGNPGKLVSGGSNAASNRSRLIWTTWCAVTCRWHWSQRGVIFNSLQIHLLHPAPC